MIYKKLKKNIEQKAILKVEKGKDYTGTTPVIVDNTQNTISLENSFIQKVNESVNEAKVNELIVNGNFATNEKVDNLETSLKQEIANATPQDYQQIKQQVETNKNDISNLKQEQTTQNENIQNNTSEIENVKLVNTTQTQELASLKTQLQELLQDQANDMSYVGEISDSGSYKNGDYGFKSDGYWYIYDNGEWKKINQQISVDLANYYNKDEVNVLLANKVDNSTYTQDKQTLGERLSAIELKNTQQDSAIETKLDKSVYESDKSTFATKEEMNKYLYLDNKTLSVNNGNVKRFDIISSSSKTSIAPKEILLSSQYQEMLIDGNLGNITIKSTSGAYYPLKYNQQELTFQGYDYEIPHCKWVKDYVAANATPQDYQQIKQQVETNKQDIVNINSKIPTFATNDSVDSKINSINIFAGCTLKENTDFRISGKEIIFNGFIIPKGYAFYFNGYFETNNGDYIYPNASINYNGGNSLFNNANSWNTGEVIPLLFTCNNKLVVKSDKFSAITKVNNLRVYFKRVG